jgi:hypothetical protein
MIVVGSGRSIVLGIFPTARGFGWAAFESPISVLESGTFVALGRKNVACLEKVDALCRKFAPETVVLEAFDRPHAFRAGRIVDLGKAISSLVAGRGHELTTVARSDVQAAFAPDGARTRDEIAGAIAWQVPGLAHRLPTPRKAWESEKRVMAMFNAAALVLTHYRDGAAALLDDLRSAA